MIEVTGQKNTALCYCETLDDLAREQIRALCDRESFAGSKIRIMPDVHAGKGCTIGTTMTITDKVVPNLVGVDIGCGMETVKVAERRLSFRALDDLIRKAIPSGRSIRSHSHEYNDLVDLEALRCAGHVNIGKARLSLGSLGGGNHFIEVDRDDRGCAYLVIHSGSRHLGVEVCSYYQEKAREAMAHVTKEQIRELIEELRAQGRYREIEPRLKELREAYRNQVPDALAYLEGPLFQSYIHDMKIVQQFAALNRKAMADILLRGMELTETDRFTTIHNYIDTDHMILRKGAVSAQKGEKLLIPINMRDGSLVCIGKGNLDWNCSAPHGAGRLLSRRQAREQLNVEAFQDAMEGIYTTCISSDTLDESPMAYKSMDEILRCIGPTAQVVERIRPVYNFKAAD